MPADFKQGANLVGKILASSQVGPTYSIGISGGPTGGTFTLTVQVGATSQTTTALNYNATKAEVKAALEALSLVGAGNVTLTAGSLDGGPYYLSFANKGLTLKLTSALTGGTTPVANLNVVAVTATAYTVPVGSAVKCATFTLTNVNIVPGVVSVSVIPNGGTADGTHVVLSRYTIAAGDSIHLTEAEGDFWDAGTTVTVTAELPVNYKITGAVSS